jgi:hypothetical protein
MKQFIFSCFFIFCVTAFSKAQDSLIMKSGEVVLAKVIEVTTLEVKYKKLIASIVTIVSALSGGH